MKLSTKLMTAPALTALVAIAAGGLFSLQLHSQNIRQRQAQSEDLGRLQAVGDAQRRLGAVQADVYRTLAAAGANDERRAKEAVGALNRELDAVQSALGQMAAAAAPGSELKQRAEALAPTVVALAKESAKAVETSAQDAAAGAGALKSADVAFEALRKSVTELGALVQAAQATRLQDAERAERQAMLLAGGLFALVAFGLLGMAWAVQRRMLAEVGRALALSREVAAGNLGSEAASDRHDEIGDLLRALSRMVVQLRESMRTVHEAAQSMGTAAGEIAAGNADLSHRTELTASSLQQSASSMEQLTGNVHQTAESARTAAQLAASACGVAQRGGEVVSHVVTTMDEINAASRRIADIIGTIDGIAFQTNILALNAAVEAARAGEQGRGFAVVAGEVRSLAQRSAAAAREIKTLIGSSVDKVEAGARLVTDAGKTMDEIVSSVQRVTDVIAEISASAEEQSRGIAQVNGAVSQLERATQQNAALVEQSAAASESLRSQTGQLAAVVASFRLGQVRAGSALPGLAATGTAGRPAVGQAAANSPATVAKAAIEHARATAAAPKTETRRASVPAASKPSATALPAVSSPLGAAHAVAADSDEWETF